ncbi:capsular biosynthesis protein [Vibrio vulnificus]
MFLIMSAAYIDQELKSEFGAIPPSLLPLGNRRLFQHQLRSVPADAEVFLSLPETYELLDTDARWLAINNVSIIYTPDDLELGAALIAALNLADCSLNTPLHLLFGDTLINPLPAGDDIIAISDMKDSYNWAVVTNDEMQWLESIDNRFSSDSNSVVSGYFKFSQPRKLIKAITQSKWDFIKGLNRYHIDIGLTAVKIDNWLDFGHVNTYYRSKASFTTQRAFNELLITPAWIEKSSYKNKKIRAEANWFENLPEGMRYFIPQYLGSDNVSDSFKYRLEYLHNTALNELFVFAKLPTVIWKQILLSCFDFIDCCLEYPASNNIPSNTLEQLFWEKTEQRLEDFCRVSGIDINQTWFYNDTLQVSLSEIISESEQYLPSKDGLTTVLHGDFCFSNILYDFRTGRVKTIDPRGITPDGELTIYGDTRYDIAKLSHSVLGLYDWIIAGYYSIDITDSCIHFEVDGVRQHKSTQQTFIELVEARYGLTALNLYSMQIQLFLSMLPLHADEPKRQKALMANAFRLFEMIKRFEQ